MMTEHDAWWQTGIIYQIYPRSFLDSNHDGIGDLSGILHRLDYLQWLGMDAIWLSPINTSPMADFGYDVANYTDVDPIFGTLTDFTRLAEATHERGMKLLLDLVPNHSSDEHPWFVESRASRDNPRRDWYIWRDPAPDGGPPNNWWSRFGGPAWDYDAGTGQYYLHLFDPKQPDLNWRNPDVRAAIYDAMPSFATTRKTRTGRRATRPGQSRNIATAKTSPKYTRLSARCGSWSTPTEIGCSSARSTCLSSGSSTTTAPTSTKHICPSTFSFP
jgi:hypothetical protein